MHEVKNAEKNRTMRERKKKKKKRVADDLYIEFRET